MFSLSQILQMRRSFRTVKQRKKKNRPPGLTLREIREISVGNEELLKSAVENLTANGIRVLQAETNDDALNLLRDEAGDARLVVKSKSNVTKELKITDFLEGLGKTVVETDIGDRLLQILGGSPSHPTGPASHLSAEEMAPDLEKHFGRDIGRRPEDIVEALREDIAGHIDRAGVAIVGANAISAEEGSIVILHNEGNISEIIQRTGKLLVVTGIDKVYENLEQVMHMVKSLAYNATGAKLTSFVNIISGPSKTADIEKKLITGVHNPREVVLILINGRRREISRGGFREMLYCIGCGSCLVFCPMFNVVGDRFAHGGAMGGRGILMSYLRDGKRDAADTAGLCMTCFHCMRECPVDINLPGLIWRLRKREGRSNLAALVRSRLYYVRNLVKLKHHEFRHRSHGSSP
jgi:L-lactate dehydrogenase complex protein LldG